MEITDKFLRIDNHACDEGYKWWLYNEKPTDVISTAKKLNSEDHNDWASWLIVRFMSNEQKVQYAIFSAEQVIDIFEKKYPNDDRPRKAIEAAKNYLKDKSKKKADAAYAAHAAAYAAHAAHAAYAADAYAADAYAATAAAYAAYAATAAATDAYAAYDAAYAADAAAAAAYDAAYAADAAAAAAAYDATAAAYAAAYARKDMQNKILEYGIGLFK